MPASEASSSRRRPATRRCPMVWIPTSSGFMEAMNITLSHDHIAIRVVDYAGTLRWYTEKLDFHVDVEWPYGDMQLAYLSNGTAKVEVLGGATADPQPDPISLEPTFRHEGLNPFCLAIE